MRAPILNRQFQHPADGYYAIETPGEHPNAAAGVVQVIDAKAVDSIVNRFNQEAEDYRRRTGRDYPGMLIDHEHFKHDPEKETTAYGWLMRLENRGGVPYGKIMWTNTGKPAVDGASYRFFSTEYDPADLVVLNDGKPKRVRPMRLDGLTLTNDPNNKGGAPITNRAGGVWDDSLAPGPENFPTPELDKWFAAVASIQESAATHGRVAIDWRTAWNMAKQQFPEIYAAAFSAVENAAATDATSTAAAVNHVATLANRVSTAAGISYHQAWNFVRSTCPAIYNRGNPRRDSAQFREAWLEPDLHNLQGKASELIMEMATAEQTESRMPFSFAYQTIQNRHPALAKLAKGEITPSAAFAKEPELRNRLM
jgi:hypothetical protein